jgi:hypothetical protein
MIPSTIECLDHAAFLRSSSRLIQSAIWFQLVKIWATNLSNIFSGISAAEFARELSVTRRKAPTVDQS